ncbi:hypothetical protein [Streptomyces sp. NPDC096934]|uniref:hypothetical protein n=1 Tax=Streptomyces sp. NPDC096934 TaxID=3155551 RepID=UPI00331BDECA
MLLAATGLAGDTAIRRRGRAVTWRRGCGANRGRPAERIERAEWAEPTREAREAKEAEEAPARAR